MSTIASQVDSIDPYSIDECFANMSGYELLGTDLTALGVKIKDKVLQDVGIPTCVGIAPTKTLAKYCNHLAKKYSGLNGVCNWLDLNEYRQAKALTCQPFLKFGVSAEDTQNACPVSASKQRWIWPVAIRQKSAGLSDYPWP